MKFNSIEFKAIQIKSNQCNSIQFVIPAEAIKKHCFSIRPVSRLLPRLLRHLTLLVVPPPYHSYRRRPIRLTLIEIWHQQFASMFWGGKGGLVPFGVD